MINYLIEKYFALLGGVAYSSASSESLLNLYEFKKPEQCEGLVRMFLRFRFCGIVCCVLYRFPFPQSDL